MYARRICLYGNEILDHFFILQSKGREILVLVVPDWGRFNWSPDDIALFKMKWNLFALQFIWIMVFVWSEPEKPGEMYRLWTLASKLCITKITSVEVKWTLSYAIQRAYYAAY